MPSTYTSLLRLTLPADGELIGTWGQVVNNGITTLEESAIAGTSAIALADANRTLTTANGATDEARNMVLAFTGALTAQRDIIVPTSSKIYFVRNATTGGFGLNVKTAAGTGTVVPAGTSMLVYCNGTNVVTAITSLVGTGQFLADNGTAALPAYSFLSDPDLGIYRISADTLGFSAAGLLRMQLDTNGTLSVSAPTNPGAPCVAMIAASGGFGVDIRGRSADDMAVIRLLNNVYSVQRATFQCDNANGYVGTSAALPFSILTNGASRLAFTAAGIATFSNNVASATQMAAPNVWVGETAGAAGTMGISSSVGASTIYWGNSAAGAGRYDIYTGGGPALILPRVASAVNYLELHQGSTGNGPSLKAVGSDANVQFNYHAQASGSHAFWVNNAAQVVVTSNPGATRYLSLTGGVGANPIIADSGAAGVRFANSPLQVIGVTRPWTGSVTESQSYMYNVALGICNATAAADSRIHEWYKDSVSLYGLWISDNTGAATPWLRVTGGIPGTSSIDFTGNGVNFVTTTGGVVITSSATSNGALVVTDTGAAGSNIKMTGNGATTPNKFLRVVNGNFEIISSAYSASLLTVPENGDIVGLASLGQLSYKLWTETSASPIASATANIKDKFVVLGSSRNVGSAEQGTKVICFNTSGANRTLTASGITIVLAGNTAAITVVTVPIRGMVELFWVNSTYVEAYGVGCTGA